MRDLNVVTPRVAAPPPPRAPGNAMGDVLVEEGRLKHEQVDRILHAQREMGLRFGETGIALGLLEESDVQLALARQFGSPYVTEDEEALATELVTVHAPFSAQSEAIRALRTELVLGWLERKPTRRMLAILSPRRRDGRTFIAANLAVAFAQLGQRTLLVDADLRNPRQHAIFGVDNRLGLSALLSKRAGTEVVQRVPVLADLAVLPAGTTPPNPAELLSRPALRELLHQLAANFDLVILDTPPAVESSDAQVIARRAESALLVARENVTGVAALRGVIEGLHHLETTLVGTVMNRA